MIQIQLPHPPAVFEFSHPQPHPQFVAAKSLILYSSEIIFTIYLMHKRQKGEEIVTFLPDWEGKYPAEQ